MNAPTATWQEPPALEYIPSETEPATAQPLDPAPRETVRLGDLKAPSRDSGRELICDRFLCRAASLLFVGPTGAGKSSAAMQAGIQWTIGRSFFGLRPVAPLCVLYVQAENDEGDLYEIRNGIFEGLNIPPGDGRTAGNRFRIATVNDVVGAEFLAVLRSLLAEHHPDLLILDPLLAYIGGDVTRQDVTAAFVRSGLQPAIAEANCGLVLVHHPPKPRQDKGEAKSCDDAYFGAGSADLPNWARAIVVLKPTTHHGIYKLRLAKRGQRAGWVEADGVTPRLEHTIAHGERGLIYWRDVEEGEQFRATPSDSAAGDLLALVPLTGSILKSDWLEKARAKGIGERRAGRILDTLQAGGRVHIWLIRRPNCRAAVALAREPQPGGEP